MKEWGYDAVEEKALFSIYMLAAVVLIHNGGKHEYGKGAEDQASHSSGDSMNKS